MIRYFFLFMLCAGRLAAQAATPWAATTNLPNVDFAGTTAAQRDTALRVMRDQSCACGCGMKIAQCRVEDPKCLISRGLAAKAVKAAREGKDETAIKAVLAGGAGPQQLLDEPVAIPAENAPAKGPATARITLTEFSDFECPYCSQAVLELETILKAFPKDVRLVYKQFPLTEIHKQSMLAAQAAIAANLQGKFWPLHDRMFAHHNTLTRTNILGWAKESGVAIPKFTADMDSPQTKQQVLREIRQGEDAGVEGTPSVFVNGKHYNGKLTVAEFSEVLRQELKQAKPAR